MEHIGARLRELISAKTIERIRYVQMKETTGISVDIWKNFWFNRKKPDAEMIESVARAWPEYAYWLATGATDLKHGHICPVNAICLEKRKEDNNIGNVNYFRRSINACIAIEEAISGSSPEQAKEITTHIINFLNGENIHEINNETYLVVDNIFKQIKSTNTASSLRDAEVKLEKNND